MKEASHENNIINLAKEFSFEVLFRKPENCLIRFHRDNVKIDLWHSKMTVAIYIAEHTRDKYLYEVSKDDLVEIFANPEYHYDGRVKTVNRQSYKRRY